MDVPLLEKRIRLKMVRYFQFKDEPNFEFGPPESHFLVDPSNRSFRNEFGLIEILFSSVLDLKDFFHFVKEFSRL